MHIISYALQIYPLLWLSDQNENVLLKNQNIISKIIIPIDWPLSILVLLLFLGPVSYRVYSSRLYRRSLHSYMCEKWKSLSHVITFLYVWKVKVKVAQSCLTICPPWTIQSMEFSRPEYWSGNPSLLQRPSQPRDWTQVSCNAGRFFTSWATREVLLYVYSRKTYSIMLFKNIDIVGCDNNVDVKKMLK